jgi:hypothetical protein
VKDITLKDFKAIIDENDKVARNPTHFTGVGTSQNSEMISNGTLKSYTINDLSSYSEYSTTMTSRKTQDQSSFSYINACNIVKVDNEDYALVYDCGVTNDNDKSASLRTFKIVSTVVEGESTTITLDKYKESYVKNYPFASYSKMNEFFSENEFISDDDVVNCKIGDVYTSYYFSHKYVTTINKKSIDASLTFNFDIENSSKNLLSFTYHREACLTGHNLDAEGEIIESSFTYFYDVFNKFPGHEDFDIANYLLINYSEVSCFVIDNGNREVSFDKIPSNTTVYFKVKNPTPSTAVDLDLDVLDDTLNNYSTSMHVIYSNKVQFTTAGTYHLHLGGKNRAIGIPDVYIDVTVI